jgi:hypothetical protein
MGRTAHAQYSNAEKPQNPPMLPEHRITYYQLNLLQEKEGKIEKERAYLKRLIKYQAENAANPIPEETQDKLFDDVDHLDITSILLPICQKYWDEEAAEAMLLLYDGQTGEELARSQSRDVEKVIEEGLSDEAALKEIPKAEDADKKTAELMTKRVSEMSQNEIDQIKAEEPAWNGPWLKVWDEMTTALKAKAQAMIQSSRPQFARR